MTDDQLSPTPDENPAPGDSTVRPRRGFLKWMTVLTGGITGALSAVPGLGMLLGPWRSAARTAAPALHAARKRDLVVGRPRRVELVGDQHDAWLRLENVRLGAVYLTRDPAGPVRALSAICPHLGCGIDWNDATRHFECPCHDSTFDPDGRRVSGPAPRDMDEIEVVTEDGGEELKVRYRRFRSGTARKVPV